LKPTRAVSPPGTYFVTFITWQRRRLFVVEPYVRLFLKTLYDYRRQAKFQLQAFAVMPEHVHLLLTPAHDVTLELARFGKEGLPIIGFAMPRTLPGIAITSIKIR
jgi:REP element-mobilizing transposase RayT